MVFSSLIFYRYPIILLCIVSVTQELFKFPFSFSFPYVEGIMLYATLGILLELYVKCKLVWKVFLRLQYEIILS